MNETTEIAVTDGPEPSAPEPKAEELVRIYAPPTSLGTALAALEGAAKFNEELSKMNKLIAKTNSRLGLLIAITTIGAVETLFLLFGVFVRSAS